MKPGRLMLLLLADWEDGEEEPRCQIFGAGPPQTAACCPAQPLTHPPRLTPHARRFPPSWLALSVRMTLLLSLLPRCVRRCTGRPPVPLTMFLPLSVWVYRKCCNGRPSGGKERRYSRDRQADGRGKAGRAGRGGQGNSGSRRPTWTGRLTDKSKRRSAHLAAVRCSSQVSCETLPAQRSTEPSLMKQDT